MNFMKFNYKEMRMKKYLLLPLTILLAGCGSESTSSNTPNQPTHVIPLYSHPPSDAWDKLFLFNHLTKDNVIVIMNPSDGDFTYKSSSYDTVLKQLKSNNIFTVGYLYTNYAQRDPSEIKANIDNYKKYYPDIDGYFFDEMNRSVEKLNYYKDLVTYTKNYTILNPGTSVDQKYLDEKFTDLIVNREGDYKSRASLNTPNEKTKLAIMYYNAPKDATIPESIKYTYIDDDESLRNFSEYYTPKSWQLYSTLAHNAKLQYPNSTTSYIFPDDLAKLPQSVEFFMDKELMRMNICKKSAQRNEFRFLDEFDVNKAQTSLEITIDTLSANNDVTLMQVHSKTDATPPEYIPLLRVSYYDNKLWAHIKDEDYNTSKVELGTYHDKTTLKEEVDQGILNIYIDGIKVYTQDISYWKNRAFLKFGLYPQTDGCDQLDITNINYIK